MGGRGREKEGEGNERVGERSSVFWYKLLEIQ